MFRQLGRNVLYYLVQNGQKRVLCKSIIARSRPNSCLLSSKPGSSSCSLPEWNTSVEKNCYFSSLPSSESQMGWQTNIPKCFEAKGLDVKIAAGVDVGLNLFKIIALHRIITIPFSPILLFSNLWSTSPVWTDLLDFGPLFKACGNN